METIAAISTPLGEGGVGIVRISGPHALDIANRIFLPDPKSRKKVRSGEFKSHTIYHGKIILPIPPPSPFSPLPRGRGVGGEVERGLRGEVANAMRGK